MALRRLLLLAAVAIVTCSGPRVFADTLCGDVEETSGYYVCVGTTCAESYESCVLGDRDAQGNILRCECAEVAGD
jgi:hypothetical protein